MPASIATKLRVPGTQEMAGQRVAGTTASCWNYSDIAQLSDVTNFRSRLQYKNHFGMLMEPLLDRRQLSESLAAMGDDPKSSLEMILELYLEDAPQLIAAIAQASAQSDLDGLRFSAHSLKSSSSTLGAKRLASLCQQMEYKARSGDSSNLSALNQQIQATYQETLVALRNPDLL